jgi:hypothetical protein
LRLCFQKSPPAPKNWTRTALGKGIRNENCHGSLLPARAILHFGLSLRAILRQETKPRSIEKISFVLLLILGHYISSGLRTWAESSEKFVLPECFAFSSSFMFCTLEPDQEA